MIFDTIPQGRNITTASSRWDSSIAFGNQSNMYKLVRALLSYADEMDVTLDEIYNQHHIESASGESLETFGLLVNVQRQTGEADNTLRARIKGEIASSISGTTFDSFVQFVASLLSTNMTNVEIDTQYETNPGRPVIVSSFPEVFDSIPIPNEEIVDLMGKSVPAGHAVRVQETGTFRLIDDEGTNDPELGLTSDSVETGGTLAEDLL